MDHLDVLVGMPKPKVSSQPAVGVEPAAPVETQSLASNQGSREGRQGREGQGIFTGGNRANGELFKSLFPPLAPVRRFSEPEVRNGLGN
jgi:hypothetical protein